MSLQPEKTQLTKLFRDDPATSEGKYLVKRRDGTVVEWPSFVLGARDPHAVPALLAYAASIEKDPDCHPGFAMRLHALAAEFDHYRRKHGAGDPTRGKHRKDDPATIAEMRGALVPAPVNVPDLLFDEAVEALAAIAKRFSGDIYDDAVINEIALATLEKVNAYKNNAPNIQSCANKSS